MDRLKNVSPDVWQRMLRRSEILQARALYDKEAAAELRELVPKIRLLGMRPADGS